MNKFLKYTLLSLGVIAVLLLAIPYFINLDNYKGSITSLVKEQTGRDLTIDGKIEFNILPSPQIKISGIKLKSLPQAKNVNFIEIEEARAKLALLPLMIGKISISKLALKSPTLNLEKLKNGKATWELSGSENHNQALTISEPSRLPDNKNINPLAGLPFNIHDINIHNGKVQYIKGDVDGNSVSDFYVEDLDIMISDVNGPINFALVLGKDIKLKGEIKEIKDQMPIVLNISASGQQIDVEGITNISASSFLGKIRGQGDLKKIISSGLPEGLKTQHKITANISANKEKASLDDINFDMDAISAKGKAFCNFGSLPNLELKFTPGDIGLSFASSENQKDGANGELKLSAANLESFIKALKLDISKLPFALNSSLSMHSKVSCHNENLLLQNMTFNLGKIQITGAVGVKNWSDKMSAPYDLNVSDASSLLQLLGYKLPLHLSKMNIKGETSLAQKAIITNTQITAAKAHIAIKGKINTEKGGKSSVVITTSGSSLNQSLQELLQHSYSPSLGAFNIAAQVEGDLTSNSTLEILIGKGEKSSLSLGGGNIYLTSKIALDLSKNKPNFAVDLNLSEVNTDKFSSGNQSNLSASSAGSSHAPQTAASSHWSRDKIDLNGLSGANGTVSIHVAKLVSGSLVFNNIGLESKLNDGVLIINSLSGELYGGKLNGSASLSSQNNQPIKLHADLKGAILKNIAPAGSKIKITDGTVDFKCDLESQGHSQFDYINSLRGNMHLTGKNGKVAGVDIHQIARALTKIRDINNLAQNLERGIKGGETNFTSIITDALIEKGVMDLTKCELASNEISVSATGKINLPKYSLDVSSTINSGVKNLPPFTVHFHGSLDNPQHNLDMNALSQHLLKHVVSGVVDDLKNGKTNPKELLNNVFDGGKKSNKRVENSKEEGDDAEASPDPMNNLVQQGLKSLFK